MVVRPQAAQFFPPSVVNEDRWYRSLKVLLSTPPHGGREKIFAQVGGVGGGGLGGGGEGGGKGGGDEGGGGSGGGLGATSGG